MKILLAEDDVQLGQLIIHILRHKAGCFVDWVTTQLSPREFQVLDLLVQNRGRALSRELILDRVWGIDADVNLKAIDAIVKLIRKKLETPERRELIVSVRSLGYKIDA